VRKPVGDRVPLRYHAETIRALGVNPGTLFSFIPIPIPKAVGTATSRDDGKKFIMVRFPRSSHGGAHGSG